MSKNYGLTVRIAISSDSTDELVVTELLAALDRAGAAALHGLSNPECPDPKTLFDADGEAISMVALDGETGNVKSVSQFIFVRIGGDEAALQELGTPLH